MVRGIEIFHFVATFRQAAEFPKWVRCRRVEQCFCYVVTPIFEITTPVFQHRPEFFARVLGLEVRSDIGPPIGQSFTADAIEGMGGMGKVGYVAVVMAKVKFDDITL